jgi:spermidine/putrescine transport system substrate-binding protein
MVGPSAGLHGTLRVLAYEDSFPVEYIGPFLQDHPSLRFEHIRYDTDAEARTILADGEEPDILAACVEESLGLLVAGGRLRPLDVSRISTWDRLFPIFKALPDVVREGKVWMVPVDSAPTGLMFDTDAGPPPSSFRDLFRPELAGQVAIDAKPIIALHVGALVLGIPHPPSMSPQQLDAVTQFFLELKRNTMFPLLWASHDDIARLFRERTIVASTGFPGDTLDLRRAGLPVDFAIATEGPMLWACGYGIGGGCRNLEAAYAFLEYVLDARSQAYLATEMNFMVSNPDTQHAVTPEVRMRAHLSAPLSFGAAALPEPPTNLDAWEAAWERVMRA